MKRIDNTKDLKNSLRGVAVAWELKHQDARHTTNIEHLIKAFMSKLRATRYKPFSFSIGFGEYDVFSRTDGNDIKRVYTIQYDNIDKCFYVYDNETQSR